MPIVKQLLLKGYRSYSKARACFDNPTFLVGQNGSGKSNLADAFMFLSEITSLPLRAVFDRRAGIEAVRSRGPVGRPRNVGIAVKFGSTQDMREARFAFEVHALPTYGFEVIRERCEIVAANGETHWYDRTKDSGFRTNCGLKPSIDSSALALPVVGGDERFAPVLKLLSGIRTYAIEPRALRELQEPDDGTSLNRDGSNAASVLQLLSRDYREDVTRVQQILEAIVPNTDKVRTVKHGNKLTVEFTQKWGESKKAKFEACSMSDGTLRALGLLVAAFQKPTPAVLVIEEPEATIHPGALGSLLELIRHASRSMQVIVTTHSPELLEERWIEDRNIRIVFWNEGTSYVAPLSDSSRRALSEHLMGAGELLKANALQPAVDLFDDKQATAQLDLFEEKHR